MIMTFLLSILKYLLFSIFHYITQEKENRSKRCRSNRSRKSKSIILIIFFQKKVLRKILKKQKKFKKPFFSEKRAFFLRKIKIKPRIGLERCRRVCAIASDRIGFVCASIRRPPHLDRKAKQRKQRDNAKKESKEVKKQSKERK